MTRDIKIKLCYCILFKIKFWSSTYELTSCHQKSSLRRRKTKPQKMYPEIPEVHHILTQGSLIYCLFLSQDDCLVKVWYNTDSWRSAITPPGASPEKHAKEVDFSFVYLAHPRSVNAFSWRKTSKFMPRSVVLRTWFCVQSTVTQVMCMAYFD